MCSSRIFILELFFELELNYEFFELCAPELLLLSYLPCRLRGFVDVGHRVAGLVSAEKTLEAGGDRKALSEVARIFDRVSHIVREVFFLKKNSLCLVRRVETCRRNL